MANTTTPRAPSSSTPAQTKVIKSRFDYDQVLHFIQTKGKQTYGSHFQLAIEDRPILIRMAAYFLQDKAVCQQQGVTLDKGLMLTGPIGCGKTSLMQLMRHLLQTDQRFALKSCRDISFEFIQDGYEVIHRYSRGQLYASRPRVYCFDDLGIENNIKYFGNDCNVMAEVLLSRYDLYVDRGTMTHITTNLSASELEEAYGNRLRSRLREMVNLIAFDQQAKDKRK